MKSNTWMYIGAVILLLLAAAGICVGGFILLGAAGGAQGVTGIGSVSVVVGVLALVAGVVMIVLAARRTKQETAQNVTLKVDLPGDTKIEEMKCKSCGGTLTAENIKLVNGAPMVTCPYCNSVYSLTEEPKW
jgi:Zn finger protein HypA/HybF involved in hydrogenase expression